MKKPKKINSQKLRLISQSIFLISVIWIGVQFALFVNWLNTNGNAPYYSRPPGVEGFLPISSLMSFYYFILSGKIHPFHPAGLFIFIAILTVSFIFGKAFCSWICPIGTISEWIGDFGEIVIKKITGKKLILPRWLDYPLRSLKYFLLLFFLYSIFSMNVGELKTFLDSPYNLFADIKLYNFFANISLFSLKVIVFLFVLSIFVRNFWCRYLCPYGALLGVISLFSPNKIKRNAKVCTDCKLCTQACPANIKVHKMEKVISDECSTCMSCVEACPVKGALSLQTVPLKKEIRPAVVGVAILVIYFLIVGAAKFGGSWQNKISRKVYLEYYKEINLINHNFNPVKTSGEKQVKQTKGEL